MKLPTSNDRDRRDGGLCWVTSLDDDVAMWFDEVPTLAAAEQSLGDDGVAVEGRPGVELFLQRAVAAGAVELAVERLLRLVCWCELVFVAFNGSSTEFRIHLFEDGHAERVAECRPR